MDFNTVVRWIGFFVVSIPIIILLVMLFTPCKKSGKEDFINFEGIGRTIIDKFETSFFSPELNKVGVKAGIMVKNEPNNAAPVEETESESDTIPGGVNITRPDVCDPTVMKCTDTKQETAPLKLHGPPSGNPYGDVPIGQLDYTGFRDLAKDLEILRGAPKTLPGGKNTADCKFVADGESCPEGYNLVGASIGITGSGAKLQCNVATVDVPAVLRADVDEESGKVRRVIPINGGKGYKSNPAVLIQGAGQGAKARAFINDKGAIELVEILDGGTGYKSASTTVEAKAGQDSDTCQLCCRL